MKKAICVSFFLLPLIFLFVGFQSCDNQTESGDKEKSIVSNELPKGRLIIDDAESYVIPPTEIGPVAGPNKNGNKTNKGQGTETRTTQLKKIYKNLLMFHADSSMEVKKSKLAMLVLARNESVENLKIQVLDESNAADEKVEIDNSIDFGSKMKARLIAFGGSKLDNSFEIEALGPEEQSFKSDRKRIVWQWKITPLKEGQHDLKLSVQIVEKDGEAVYLPAKNIEVIIFAKKRAFMSKVGDFITNKYEWILTAIFLPIFVAWLSSRIRHRSNQPAQNQK